MAMTDCLLGREQPLPHSSALLPDEHGAMFASRRSLSGGVCKAKDWYGEPIIWWSLSLQEMPTQQRNLHHGSTHRRAAVSTAPMNAYLGVWV